MPAKWKTGVAKKKKKWKEENGTRRVCACNYSSEYNTLPGDRRHKETRRKRDGGWCKFNYTHGQFRWERFRKGESEDLTGWTVRGMQRLPAREILRIHWRFWEFFELGKSSERYYSELLIKIYSRKKEARSSRYFWNACDRWEGENLFISFGCCG